MTSTYKIAPAKKLPATHANFIAFTAGKHTRKAKRVQAAQISAMRKTQARNANVILRKSSIDEVTK